MRWDEMRWDVLPLAWIMICILGPCPGTAVPVSFTSLALTCPCWTGSLAWPGTWILAGWAVANPGIRHQTYFALLLRVWWGCVPYRGGLAITLSSSLLLEALLAYLMDVKNIICIKKYFIKQVYYMQINIPITFTGCRYIFRFSCPNISELYKAFGGCDDLRFLDRSVDVFYQQMYKHINSLCLA